MTGGPTLDQAKSLQPGHTLLCAILTCSRDIATPDQSGIICRLPWLRLPLWRNIMRFLHALTAASFIIAAASSAAAVDISGAGATFPYPLYAKWADTYRKQTGVGLNYQSIGSGGGIKQIQAKTVTFGASDMPLPAADLNKHGLVQFPTVMGGVVPVINVEGLQPGQLKLDGATLARIFLGEIKTWDDAAIKKLNPDLKLSAGSIVVVHRSDGSGTTFLFADYLSKVSADWKSKVGAATALEWPTGLGAKGNEGVANNVAQTKGAIGYVEFAYAKQNKLNFTQMLNAAGKAVPPSKESFQAAAANADWTGTPGFAVILTNLAGESSWPITGATFILMPKKPRDPAAATEALKFFDWAYREGGPAAEELDYVAMPENVPPAVRKMWASEITDPAGKPVAAIN
jgi:phosphate transport system substrate-binding protein